MFVSPLKLSNQRGHSGYDGSITVFSSHNQNCSSLDFTFGMLPSGRRDSALIPLFSYPSIRPNAQQLHCAVQSNRWWRKAREQLSRSSTLCTGSPLPSPCLRPHQGSAEGHGVPLAQRGREQTEMMQDFFCVMLAQPGSWQNNVDVANDCHHKQVTSSEHFRQEKKKSLLFS